MARPHHLFVFSYDVVRDSDRRRVAALLEDHIARVQKSVFEGRLTARQAEQLARRTARLLGPDDSLRIYCVTDDGRRLSAVHGRGVLAEAHDFWLL